MYRKLGGSFSFLIYSAINQFVLPPGLFSSLSLGQIRDMYVHRRRLKVQQNTHHASLGLTHLSMEDRPKANNSLGSA